MLWLRDAFVLITKFLLSSFFFKYNFLTFCIRCLVGSSLPAACNSSSKLYGVDAQFSFAEENLLVICYLVVNVIDREVRHSERHKLVNNALYYQLASPVTEYREPGDCTRRTAL